MRRAAAAAFVSALAGWAGPAVAQAQISEAWTGASTVDVDVESFSARLDAMGGLEASVEDTYDRINPYGFSDNPAGLLADQDSSSLDESSRYDSFADQYYGLPHSVVHRRSGITASLRNGQNWVLGLEGIYGGVNASRHDLGTGPDNGRFIRDFDVLYPVTIDPAGGDNHIGAKVTVPRVGITYGRKFAKKITFAGRFRYRHESESRSVPNPYDLNLSSSMLSLTGGALASPRIGPLELTVAGSAGWARNHVRGLSEGPFNEDHYDWNRPEVNYNAQLGIRFKRLRGIIDGRHKSHDGEEIAEVNWAAQYFLNPLPVNTTNPSESVFKRKWSALLSGLRRNEVVTRWMLDVPKTPAHVGFRYRYYRELEWIRPNDTVLQSVRPLDVRRLGYHTAGGVSVDLPGGRGLLATEVELTREGRVDHLGVFPEVTVAETDYHFGAEYRVLSKVPVRGGFVLIRRDPDRADGYPPIKGIRVSGGLGYYWGFLGTQIDASYAHEHVHYTPGDPSQEISRGDQAALVFRYLF
ncbi:MAG TPA: hypothetical protein VK527_01700 [Candidatus Limnocylindrales bacterium]|nr:hypothetical protein [Candidatus Limnocylindrales bacterium]